MSPSTFGRKFMKNPNYLKAFDEPKYAPNLKTVNKLKLCMKNYKPKKDRHESA